jgi:hypothetical protein
MPRTYALWARRTRTSIAGATLPWLLLGPILLIVTGGQHLRASGGRVVPSFLSLQGHQLQLQLWSQGSFVPAPPLTPAASVVLHATQAIVGLCVLTLIVLAVGWSDLRGALRRSAPRRKLWLLAWVPALSVLIDLSLILVQDRLRPTHYGSITPGGRAVAIGGHPAAVQTIGVILAVVAVVGWLVSIVCVAIAARRADIAPADLRFGRTISVVVVTLSASLLAAYVAWGAGLILQSHQAAHGSFTTLAFADQGLWVPMVLVLALAVLVSACFAASARRSWKVIALGLG